MQLFEPLLAALRHLGGSARSAEATEQVARDLKISDAERSEVLDSGQPRFDNAVAWARFYLAKAGYIDTSKRGVWTLTDKGRGQKPLSPTDALAIVKEVQGKVSDSRGESRDTLEVLTASVAKTPPKQEEAAFVGYQDELLAILQRLTPEGFERLCQQLLRESDFQEVTVTGRTGDGGIDGIGILQVNPLVSFKVIFQCKRYKGTVGAPQVRDFRGAMMGRADKGIILTTGTFSAEARKEAIRDGVPPIELVDGEKLVSLMEHCEMGLKPVQSYAVDHGFFEDFGYKK
ncbi:MAG TPA: restriction endonuclease [Polyangium sp.]|nr:restriction endonuclease [Polyangium sp.]